MNSSRLLQAEEHLAERMLRCGAVEVWKDRTPFRLSSGWLSPILVRSDRAIGDSATSALMIDSLVAKLPSYIRARCELPTKQIVLGAVATGATPWVAKLAQALRMDMCIVRFDKASPVIEGVPVDKRVVVVVEDMVTTATTLGKAVFAVRDAGGIVHTTFSIGGYGFERARDTLAPLEVEYVPFMPFSHISSAMSRAFDTAKSGYSMSTEDFAEIGVWIKNPDAWTKKHMTIGDFALRAGRANYMT